jgi:hypothetical protein
MGLYVLISIVALIAIIKFIFVLEAKSDAKKAQRNLDRNIENQLMDSISDHSLTFLAKHSDKEKIARILSARIQDLIELGIHPIKLINLFEKLGMSDVPMKTASNKEIEIASLAKQYILQNIDSHILEVYQITVCKDVQNGFKKLNNSFITKAEKNMVIWSPQLS